MNAQAEELEYESPRVSKAEFVSFVEFELVRRAKLSLRMASSKELQEQELAACADDPHRWLRNWCWLLDPKAPDPALRRIPLVAWPKQSELVDFLIAGVDSGRDRQVNKGRSLGVSWLSLALIVWYWKFEDHFLCKVGSRKEEFAFGNSEDSLMSKVFHVLDNLPPWMRPELGKTDGKPDRSMSRLYNPENGSEIVAESTNKNFGRGGRRTVVLVDEAAHIETRLQNTVALALETVALSKWFVSTPAGVGNRFHSDWKSRPEEDKMTMSWQGDPRRTFEWFNGLLREHGGPLSWDEREQEHNCSFTAVTGERCLRIPTSCELPGELVPRDSDRSRYVAAMDFGSGPSYTVWGCAVIEYQKESREVVRLWLDRVHYWQRTRAEVIANDINASCHSLYKRWIPTYGDPAGKAVESDQESWATRLADHAAPVDILDPEFNSKEYIQSGIELIQWMVDTGMLIFNADDMGVQRLLLDLRAWEWDIGRGMDLAFVNKADIMPRKDSHSHGGDMVRYLAQSIRFYHWVLALARPPKATRSDPGGKGTGHQYGKLLEGM